MECPHVLGVPEGWVEEAEKGLRTEPLPATDPRRLIVRQRFGGTPVTELADHTGWISAAESLVSPVRPEPSRFMIQMSP